MRRPKLRYRRNITSEKAIQKMESPKILVFSQQQNSEFLLNYETAEIKALSD